MAILKRGDTDRFLILSALALLVMGMVMVYSTSDIVAMNRFGDEFFFMKKHVTYALIGFMAFLAASRIPYTMYRRLVYPILILSAILLVLIYVPGIGLKAGGARRWIHLGPVAFQPSEPAKLAVVVFLAYSLSAKTERIKDFYFGFLPNIIIPGVIILLILREPDLGTSLTLGSLVLIMCFAGGVRLKYLAGLLVPLVPLVYIVITRYAYMLKRIFIFMDPWKDAQGAGFQMVQSFIAFGSGGVTGVGLGEGMQKLFYLPEAHTDFILSVIGEELGLVGVGLVIAFYIIFLISGIKITLKAKDLFGAYLALGLTVMVVMQAAVNMAVVMGLLPPKGLTLPFVSYGGTSLIINMAAVGILLNIYILQSETEK